MRRAIRFFNKDTKQKKRRNIPLGVVEFACFRTLDKKSILFLPALLPNPENYHYNLILPASGSKLRNDEIRILQK